MHYLYGLQCCGQRELDLSNALLCVYRVGTQISLNHRMGGAAPDVVFKILTQISLSDQSCFPMLTAVLFEINQTGFTPMIPSTVACEFHCCKKIIGNSVLLTT